LPGKLIDIKMQFPKTKPLFAILFETILKKKNGKSLLICLILMYSKKIRIMSLFLFKKNVIDELLAQQAGRIVRTSSLLVSRSFPTDSVSAFDKDSRFQIKKRFFCYLESENNSISTSCSFRSSTRGMVLLSCLMPSTVTVIPLFLACVCLIAM
jgi:hypothetical protein